MVRGRRLLLLGGLGMGIIFTQPSSNAPPFGLGIDMNVILMPRVEIGLRTLEEEDRRKVSVWFDHLRNWDSDPTVRKHSRKLPSEDSVYVLKTNSEFRIFFRLERDRIVILDIATKETILSSGHIPVTGQ
jgi:mRNA-degrading endonuclease RelE of RelBE toxin-antitoxin system